MDRQMLDRVLPLVYGLGIVVVAMTTHGKVIGLYTIIGAFVLAVYYAGIRPSLVSRERAGDDRPRSERRAERAERRAHKHD